MIAGCPYCGGGHNIHDEWNRITMWCTELFKMVEIGKIRIDISRIKIKKGDKNG